MKIKRYSNKGQEEMVGFALIIIIVAVLILVFLSISMNKHEEIKDSSEVRGFIDAALSYTTDCRKSQTEYLDLWKLTEWCDYGRNCYNGELACDVLNSTFKDLLNESWKVGEQWIEKGYLLNITLEGEEFFSIFEGNTTLSSKSASQPLNDELELRFIVYS